MISYPPGVSQAAFDSLSQAVPTYLNGGATMTWQTITSTYPASSTYKGMFARCSNLFGSNSGALRCETDGTNYFWMPNGMFDYSNGMTSMATDQTLTALGHPTFVRLSGTIPTLTTRSVTLSTANIWPGARKRIVTYGITSLLGTLNVLSGVSTILSIGLNQAYEFYADYSSGSPEWVRSQ